MQVKLPMRGYRRYYAVSVLPALILAAVVRYVLRCINVDVNCDMQQMYQLDSYERDYPTVTCFKENIRRTDWLDGWSLGLVIAAIVVCGILVALAVHVAQALYTKAAVESQTPAETLRAVRRDIRGSLWALVVFAVVTALVAAGGRIMLW